MKLSEKQWKRFDVAKRLDKGQLTVREAAIILGLSRRQVQRIRRRVEELGVEGVVHGNAGRSPANRLDEETARQIVKLRRTRYDGFNDEHFTEKLVEHEGLDVTRTTVRRVLRAAGIGSPRRRRPRKHHRRRERKAQAGMMLQWDGSQHDWLEGRGPRLCLMGAVDDGTGELLQGAHFVEQECSAGYLRVLLAVAQSKGLPLSIYMDRHTSLKRTDDNWTLEEELRGEQDPTHVGRALKALDIKAIYALTPQAKGRVERAWGTLQDRLVSELRLAGATTKDEANAVLEAYRPVYNRRFAIAPACAQPAWRPVRQLDLERICSFYYQGTVQNDNSVRVEGHAIDIPAGPGGRSYAKARVEVRQLLDASWRVYHPKHGCIAMVAGSQLQELRSLTQKKRPAASRVFRDAIQRVAVSLP